jgi:hypothetical protein
VARLVVVGDEVLCIDRYIAIQDGMEWNGMEGNVFILQRLVALG